MTWPIGSPATVSGTAAAQGFFTPFVGYNFGGDSVNCASFRNCDDKRTNIGMAFGSTRRFAGTEQELAYVRHFFGETRLIQTSVISTAIRISTTQSALRGSRTRSSSIFAPALKRTGPESRPAPSGPLPG